MSPVALLQVNDLVVGYDRPILGPLSFRLESGQVLGLWGPNGVGKSTVLYALVGAARIFRGQVQRRTPAPRLAYQQQRVTRLPEMPITGKEFLRFLDADHKAPPPRLAEQLDRRIDHLSGGEFQLLCIWSCLAGNADLVLLDEPTNYLDPENERLLEALLCLELGPRGIILVSHEHDFLERVCHQILEIQSWT